MVPSKDPEYDKAKSGFVRELAQFHESRGTHMKNTPKINGKEVDLYLLYQIITSHGGWEKINTRNEWDDLLEHFHLPRATNGGLAIKQIYLRFLELYEKIHFLGEDVDGRVEEEEDVDDSRHRRRHHPNKQLFSPLPQNQHSQQNSNVPVTIQDHLRGQYGMSTKIVPDTEYDRLVLSLQSPLPNDQDMAISVCTLLSNESKHVLKFHKNPQLLNLMLGHAGIFNECSLRSLYEESYTRARGLSHKNFWNEHVSDPDIRKLLCECFVPREQLTLCQYNADQIKYGPNLELDLEIINEQDLTEEEKAYLEFLRSRKRRRRKSIESEPAMSPAVDQLNQEELSILNACCALCCCQEGQSGKNIQHGSYAHLKISPSGSEDKIGQRILQVTNILRNLSFEEDNALVMASNPSMLRFLLIAANCSWGQLPQLSYDMIGNVGKYMKLHEPTTDPISSMMMDLILSGLYSNDRFKILRSLETLRELTKKEDNEHVILRYFEKSMYSRLAELLTVSDIMLLIYTLECLLALTNMGETVCNDLVSVHGSVSTLVSLVTVEAQSYGPKGCILMRVVETVTGTSVPQSAQHGSGTTVIAQTINPPTVIKTPLVSASVNSPQPSPVSSSSMQTLSTRLVINGSSSSFPSLSSSTTATGTTVIPPTQPQISTGFNNMSPNSLTLPAATTATPVAVPLVPSISTSNSQYPMPSSIYDGSNMNNCTIALSNPSMTTTLSQFHLPPLTTLSSSSTTLCPTLSPTPTPIAQVPVFQQCNATGSPKITQEYIKSIYGGILTKKNSSENNIKESYNYSKPETTTILQSASNNAVTPAIVTSVAKSSPEISSPPTLNGSPTGATSVAGTSCVGALAQVSSQSLNQQIFNPSISLVTPRGTLSEEGWAIAWLKGALELASGSSIEEGELYRMYRSARKNPNVYLTSEQFTQCVKCAFGGSVGPVIKQFGSTCLTFFDGVRPKIANRTVSAGSIETPVPVTSPVKITCINAPIGTLVETQSGKSSPTPTTAPPTQNQLSNQLPINQPTSPLPVSVHIPSRENKTMSPILKATLSRPPKPKNPTVSKGSRFQKGNKERQKLPASSGCKNSANSKANLQIHTSKSSFVKSTISPSSSAIRSLLASKVALRQQKKLQQNKNVRSGTCGTEENSDGKVNGIDGIEGEESSASSSLNSSEGSEPAKEKPVVNNVPPTHLTSFQGILRNGLTVDEFKEADLNAEDGGTNKGGKLKTMLIDLLERKVPSREPINGLLNREIRISDKGLELVDNKLQEEGNSNSSSAASVSVFNINTHTNHSVSDSQDSQQMTFYSSSAAEAQITFQGQVQSSCSPLSPLSGGSVNSTSLGTVLMSGGGGNDDLSGIQVKTQGLNLVDMSSSRDVGISIGSGDGTGNGSNSSGGTRASSPSCSGAGGGDLLEKFNQISDLIVIPPEQLGLKRTHSQSQLSSSTASNEDSSDTPPFKKPAISVNGNGYVDEVEEGKLDTQSSIHVQQSIENAITSNSSHFTNTTPSVVVKTNSQTLETKMSLPNMPSSANSNPVMQLPLRLSVSSQNSQLAFGQMRQLVIQSGQHVILPTNHSQSALQGHMIFSKPHNSSNDQMPKAIIILSSQQQVSPSQAKLPSAQNVVQPSQQQSLPQAQQQVQPPSTAPTSPVIPVLSPNSGVFGNVYAKDVNSYSNLSSEQLDIEVPYLCEWGGCGMRFPRPHQVFMHAMSAHCSENLVDAVKCEWGSNGCDPLIRKRYSLMTHLQDRHCSKPALEMALYRRRNKIEPPPAPQQPIHHPGYAPNAAFHAIKRHAMQFMNPKELLDDNEGPVTKSIRLTSALILRNLVNYSDVGRKMCSSYESHFSAIAMSNVESSRTVAQILYDMNELDRKSRLLR